MEIVERTVTYKVFDLDVWASPEGWDINNWSVIGEIQCQEFGDDWKFNVSEILKALYEKEIIRTKDMDRFIFEDYFDRICILSADDGMPLFTLEEV